MDDFKLQNKLNEIENRIINLSNQIRNVENVLFNHKHTGFDKSQQIVFKGSNSKVKAYRSGSNQSIANDTWTKVQLNATEFDYSSEFDTSTNYRFTAKETGYYLVCGQIKISNATDQTSLKVAIYKNGSSIVDTFLQPSSTGDDITTNISDIVYLKANEYLELYAYHYYGSTQNIIYGSNNTFMSIHRLS